MAKLTTEAQAATGSSSAGGQSSKRRKTSNTFGTADASERGQETLLPRRRSSVSSKKQAEFGAKLGKSPVFKDMHQRTDRRLSQAIEDLKAQEEQSRADRQKHANEATTPSANGDSAATINLDSLNLPPHVIELLEGKRTDLEEFVRRDKEAARKAAAASTSTSTTTSTSMEAPPSATRVTKTYGKRSRSTQAQAAHDAASKQPVPSDQQPPQKKNKSKRTAPTTDEAAAQSLSLPSAQVIVPDTPQTSQQQQHQSIAAEGHVSDEASETPSSKKRSRRRKQQQKRQASPQLTTTASQSNEAAKGQKKMSKKRARVSEEREQEQPTKKKQKKEERASLRAREPSAVPDSQVDELQSSAPSPVRETAAAPAPPSTAQAAAQTVAQPLPRLSSSAGVQASPPRPAKTAQAAAQTARKPVKSAGMQHQPKTVRSANRGMQTPQPSPPPERASAAAQTVSLPVVKASTSDRGVQTISHTLQQQQVPPLMAYFARPASNVAPADLAARLQTAEGAEAWRQMCAYEEQMDRLAQAWSVQRAKLFSSSSAKASQGAAPLLEPLSNAVLPQSLAEAPVALSAPAPTPTPTNASVPPQISVASPPKPAPSTTAADDDSSSSEDASSSDTDSGSDTESRRRKNSNQLFPSNNKSAAAVQQRPPRKHAVAAPVKPRHSAPLPAAAAAASASQPRLSPLNGSASRPRLSLGDLKVSISSDESEEEDDDDESEDDDDEEEERDQTLTQLGSPEPEPQVRKPRLSITHDQRARSPSSDLPSSPRSARSDINQERRPATDEALAHQQSQAQPQPHSQNQSQSRKEDVISEEPAVQADADAALTEDQTAQLEQQQEGGKASSGDERGFDTAESEPEEDNVKDKAEDAKRAEAHGQPGGSPSRFSEASLPLDTVVANDVDEQAVSAASAAAPPATSQQNPSQDSQQQKELSTANLANSNGDAPIEEQSDESEDAEEEQDQLAQTQTQSHPQKQDQVVQATPEQSTRESSPAQDSSSDASVKLREQLVNGAPTPQNPVENGTKPSSPPKTGSQTSPPKQTQDLPKAPNETPLFNPTQPSSGDGKARSSGSSSYSSSSEDEEDGDEEKEEDSTARREGMASTKRNSFPASDSRTTGSQAKQAAESPPTPRPGLRQNGSLAHTLSSMLNRRNSGLGMRGSRQPPPPSATQSPSSFNLPGATTKGPVSASQPTPRRSTRQTTASQSSTDNESDSNNDSSSSDSDGEDAGPQKAREKARAIRLESASQPTRSKTRSTANGPGTPKAQQLPASQPARMTRSAGRRQTGTYGR